MRSAALAAPPPSPPAVLNPCELLFSLLKHETACDLLALRANPTLAIAAALVKCATPTALCAFYTACDFLFHS